MIFALIGMRACGKTTIGRLLATRLRRRFVDLDERTLASFGQSSVSAVWAAHGETAWRSAELAALGTALHDDDVVLSLGGGTPVIPGAAELIGASRRAGRLWVAHLRCEPGELVRRLERSPSDRPRLSPHGLAEEVAHLLAVREPAYQAMANVEIDVTRASPAESVDELLAILNR